LSDSFRFYAYTDKSLTNPKILGQVGKTYTLNIYANGAHITGSTTINSIPEVDSVYTGVPPNARDTNRRAVFLKLRAPGSLANYYKFYNCKNLRLTGIAPVDDYFLIPQYAKSSNQFSSDYFKGKQVLFPAQAGYHKHDTAIVKFSHIDYAQFNFWTSVSQSSSGQGSPFSSPAYIVSNVTGGVGIWAGMSSAYVQVVIAR
jgi:hypothetical protein